MKKALEGIREILGYTPERIEVLKVEGVINATV
jgi:hypothetical protein